ncbi:DUF2155 domain-containing protein [Telmatospirillum sp. J64-1]|uniref:DUF2155 domain-containing protein n=1 Tax=Telmatospirillum sp. J64-1 TaxID=2502183 RepID=UPI00115D83DC|nr:DUF2155 domain-containing protein [Telmatospirillum sp. J64-1]
MNSKLAVTLTAFSLLAMPAAARAADMPMDIAVLQALDKATARVQKLRVPVGEAVRFGTLQIIARTCRERPPEEQPESAVFLDVWESRQGEAAEGVFRGWMFASSPGLSAMEHPVYDIWVIGCESASSQSQSNSQ